MMQEDRENHTPVAEPATDPEPAMDAAPRTEPAPEPEAGDAAAQQVAAVPAPDCSTDLDAPLEAKDIDFDVDFDDSDLGPSLADQRRPAALLHRPLQARESVLSAGRHPWQAPARSPVPLRECGFQDLPASFYCIHADNCRLKLTAQILA